LAPTFHVGIFLLCLFVAGCAKVSVNSGVSGSAAPDPGCSLERSPPEISAAVCGGDSNSLTKAIFSAATSEGRFYSREVLEPLEKVWRRNPSAGTALPWKKLDQPGFRAALAVELAQAARHGGSAVSLREMENLAIELSRSQDSTDRFRGIQLLGFANVGGQIDFLQSLAISARDPVLSNSAVFALASLCDSGAEHVLRSLVRANTAEPRVPEWASDAISDRANRPDTWCDTTILGR
jgi:hypothetical protein